MTTPGNASEVGSIIGYLSLNRSQWNRDVDDTERDSHRLGRLNPDIRIRTNAGDVAVQLALVHAAETKIGSSAAQAQPFVVNLWAALAALAPAAVPIAGVLGGAMIGLVPLVATVALGISGINDELKSGQLEGTKYGQDLEALGTEVERLKKLSADGILSGVDRGLAASHGLFAEVNSDIGTMAGQVGNIIAGGMPALLRILTQLNPLFVTFGNLVSRGATELEGWSQHSQGVQHFVAYVQTALPQVMAFLGNVVVLFSHLAQAAAPFGGVLLTELTMFVRVLNAIPIDVLQTAIPLAVSLYVALKAYQVVTRIVEGTSKAIVGVQAAHAASAASVAATSLAYQATMAEEAAATAAAKAAEASAAAESAVAIAASVEGTSSVLAAGATAAAESAIEFAAAMQVEADAAAATAVSVGASATAAGGEVAAAGATASKGWVGLLGPLAAVGIGVVLLTSLFGDNDDAAQHNQEIMNGYAQSLKQSANALADVNVQQTAKNLVDEGAIKLMDKLNAKSEAALGQVAGDAKGIKLSQAEIVLAVNGTTDQYDKLYDSLIRVADANRQDTQYARGPVKEYNATGEAASNLAAKVKELRTAMTAEMKEQALLTQINRDSQAEINGGTTATAAQARALGVTTDAYLDAQLAAKKNVEQTKAQALAFRLANDGGALLALTLDKLSGKKLGYQQALNSFQQQLLSGAPTGTGAGGNEAGVTNATNRRARAIEAEALAQHKYDAAIAKGASSDTIAAAHLRLARAKDAVTAATSSLSAAQTKNAGTLTADQVAVTGMSAAAVQNRGNILGLVTTAEAAAEAYGKLHGGSEAARQKLKDLRTQLIDSRVAMGENRAEVTKYVDSILTIPAKVPPTELEVKKAAAEKKITDLQDRIDRIRQGKEPHLDANSVEANGVITALQQKIDRLEGKTVYINLQTIVSKHTEAGNAAAQQSYIDYLNSLAHKAAGGPIDGPINGPGPKGVDSLLLWGAPGEYMMNPKAVDKYGMAFMHSVNAGTLNLRGGDGAGSRGASPAAPSGSTAGAGGKSVRIDKFEQHFHYPEPERPSQTTSRSMEMAAYALGGY